MYRVIDGSKDYCWQNSLIKTVESNVLTRGLRTYKLDKICDSNNDGNIDKSELLKIVVSQNQQMQIRSNSVKNDNRK
ncbi:hypothetical protein BGI30_09505 [Snodgrassella alvi]|jgi:hypothetical protein|nr:hypothetical protein BGI30_09505 [Snodgrassella alvi]PIT56990.1 hypothetical protein BHC59_05630 [Snodgrassella alvi]